MRTHRNLWLGIFILILAGVNPACSLYLHQDRMIYHPARYGPEYDLYKTSFFEELKYHTKAGDQVALYIPPRSAPKEIPERMWIFFGGNHSLALNWRKLVQGSPDPRAGYLLFDFPGYGNCQGEDSPETILESSEAAMNALAQHLGVPPERLYRHLNLLGYSLGTAAALQLAAHTRPERVMLFAPFTSLMAMARREVGWPLCLLLRQRFDNEARLAELAGRGPDRPDVMIVHGDADGIVPVSMSREMARRFKGWIKYIEIPGANHWQVVAKAGPLLAEIMQKDMVRGLAKK